MKTLPADLEALMPEPFSYPVGDVTGHAYAEAGPEVSAFDALRSTSSPPTRCARRCLRQRIWSGRRSKPRCATKGSCWFVPNTGCVW